MRYKIIFLTIILIVLAFLGSLFMPFSITTNMSNRNSYLTVKDTLLIDIPDSDYNDSKITLYIKLSTDDHPQLPEQLLWKKNLYHKVYYTSEHKDIKRIVESMRSIVTNGDIATATSEIFIAKNDSTLFRSGIVIDYECGLQSEEFGYCRIIDKNNFIESISKMKPYYFPRLFLK